MTDHLIPTLPDVVGAAKDAIVESRPATAPHVESGVWAVVLSGWRGQFAKASARLVDEAKSARLPLAEGAALTPIAAVDFFTPRQPDPLRSVGEVILERAVVHYTDGDPITAAEATDETTSLALIQALAEAGNEHFGSVWSPSSGLGSHLADDGSSLSDGPTTTMDDLVALANDAKSVITAHAGNLDAHPDADTTNTVTVDDAFVSDTGMAYSAQSQASKASLWRVLNACRSAFNAHVRLEARAGTIRKGTRFLLAAQPTASPPLLAGTYEATADVPLATGADEVTVPVQAPTAGAAANLAAWVSGQGPEAVVTAGVALFDASQPEQARLAVASLAAAGGRDGAQPDRPLRQAASASYAGLRGPIDRALVAGALRGLGASRVAILTDYAAGGVYVYVTDESWAQSERWLASIAQGLKDPDTGWLGLGCRLRGMGAVVNRLVRPELTISVRDVRYLQDTTELTATLQALVRAYFDDREDWYTIRSETLQALCSAADRKRILTCSRVRIRDGNGIPVDDTGTIAAGDTLIHNHFADQPLDVTYTAPQ